jgi:hypothetical protein
VRKVLVESGLRDISALRKRYPKAEIYFHQDLDGVTTAIAMKKYLEDNGIQVVGAHIIQYGDKEFAVKKNDAQGDVMPVLVDFAHGKPMFKIHTDHHDRQVGAEKDASKSFRQARSNVETISQIVSPKDIFPSADILLISTVDSADFARQDIKPEEVVNYVFRLDKEKPLQKNKMLLGFVINKLILAFKNRKGFMEELVMDSEPSLMSILTNIKQWMKQTNAEDVNKLQGRSEDYLKQMKTYPKSKVEDGIIFQYGAGSMKTGSYDRYTPFRVNPDADFLVIMWPLGLLQASCNPFKKERKLKGVNLGEIAQEVLKIYEPQLKNRKIPLSTLKWISEISVGPESVGFTFQDFDALYGGKIAFMEGGEEILKKIKSIMDKPFSELSESEKETLDKIGVNMWDFIQSNSGGHKCITNISGLNYLGRKTRPSEDPYRYDADKPDVPYIKFMKQLGNKFVDILKEKIKNSSEKEVVSESEVKKKYYIDSSKIEGKGVFAKKDLEEGETIGLLHTINKPYIDYNFTELGEMHNHSETPNCHNVLKDNKRFLTASRKIKKGEELTTNYRLQPDLEQPMEGWELKESLGKEMKPQVDGYRTYSPFQDLDYIIVDGNGIDCDNIVWDLILLGNDGSVKFGPKNSGAHYLEGATKVVELPFKNNEDIKLLTKDKDKLKEWILNYIEKVDKNFEIRRNFFDSKLN